jgi:CRISPR-associated protein Cmr2
MAKLYLISLSIGPVQDFIAAARRTRDLWFGSYVLSEVSKAAACYFKNEGAELIFPAPTTDLTPDSKQTENKDNVGNKILVLIKTDNPQEIINKAQQATKERWETIAEEVNKKLEVNDTIWQAQISDVLEFFSAWVLLEDERDYSSGRERLDQLLNARKNTRNFIVNSVEGDGIAKSSLDGLRETVLPQQIKLWQKYTLGLSAGEELDCIGVVKRLGGDIDQFTPLSRLAIDSWLRHPQCQEQALKNTFSVIKEIFSELEQTNLGLVSLVTGNNAIYETFPFDAQLLYDFRIQAEQDGLARLEKDADRDTKKNIDIAKQHLEKLAETTHTSPFKDLPKPSPYMAILAADGDRMGELLDSINSIEAHQEISKKLADFATQVPTTVRAFQGHCIYAGGDDVLALLPLDKAIACSRKLAADFTRKLSEIQAIATDKIPTLSVGLGVSHFLTPMGTQLELARRAEQLAKSNDKPTGESKNALGILLQPRSGAEISFRERWTNKDDDNHIPADKVLEKWIKAHNDNLLPRRVGYELRELSFALNWCEPQHKPFIEQEVSRILKRKRNKEGSPMEDVVIAGICKRAAAVGLARLANELIITRRFAEVYKLSGETVLGEGE